MNTTPHTPRACPECLRRASLLRLLGPYVERHLTHSPSGTLLHLLAMPSQELVATVAPNVCDQLLSQVDAMTPAQMTDSLGAAECWACCRHDELYPGQLRDLDSAPWALIARGDPGLLAQLSPSKTVAVVGSRRATSYGREVARQLGTDIAARGLIVLSGLAHGIDSCAHRGALDTGRTVAVLGCGPDVVYPAAHRALWRRIGDSHLVLSELPPGASPWRWTFPARNRIVAALAGMTVVVESRTRSGSQVTADLASGLGRRLGAVPGPISSRASDGPNALLARRATVIRDARDVLGTLRP